MSKLNLFAGIGRFAFDPELKQSKEGKPYLNGRVAIAHPYKEKETCWIDILAFGRTAEFIGQYFKKGSSIVLEGLLYEDTYMPNTLRNKEGVVVENKDGIQFQKIALEVSRAGFGDPKREGGENDRPATRVAPNAKPAMVYDAKPTQAPQQQEPDGDLPF